MARSASYRGMERRYPVLRFCSTVFMMLGILGRSAGGLGLLASLFGVLAGVTQQAVGGLKLSPQIFGLGTLGLFWSAGLLVAGVQAIAVGSLIRLLIDLEENTRASALTLKHLSPSRPASEGPGDRPRFVS